MPQSAAGLAAVKHAARYVGVKENPPGSNHGQLIDRWCQRCIGVPGGFPWCAAFVWCMFDDVGVRLTKIRQPALVESWDQWATANGHIVSRPFAGDVICFDWNRNDWSDHIGLVEKVLALRWKNRVFVGYVRTIEGNTSSTDDSDGGRVERRWRWVNDKTRFVRVPGKPVEV